MPTAKGPTGPIEIAPMETETVHVWVLGRTPLICNRLAEKARQELLVGGQRRNSASARSRIKHDPFAEYRSSVYRLYDENAPTVIALKTSGFKCAMMTGALDHPDAKKATIGRLVWVDGEVVPVFGTPFLSIETTRSADINRTPDQRTRAILPEWACPLSITFMSSLVKAVSVVNLLALGGLVSGVGDWRPEKGKGTYGQFEIVNDNDPRLQTVLGQGRAVQLDALRNPQAYNQETEELLQYVLATAPQRGWTVAVDADPLAHWGGNLELIADPDVSEDEEDSDASSEDTETDAVVIE